MHIHSFFGLTKLIDYQLKMADSKGWNGRSLPSIATKYAHEAVVKLLLARDVYVNLRDKYDQTPLSCAVKNRHDAVVKLLLARDDVDVNSRGDRTLLQFHGTCTRDSCCQPSQKPNKVSMLDDCLEL